MWHLTFLFMCAVPTTGRQSKAPDVASDAPDPDHSAGCAVLPLHRGVLQPPQSSQQPLGFPSTRVRFGLDQLQKLETLVDQLHCYCSQPSLNHMYSLVFEKIEPLVFRFHNMKKSETDMANNGMHFSCNSNFIGTENLSPTPTELQALHYQQQNPFTGFWGLAWRVSTLAARVMLQRLEVLRGRCTVMFYH